MSTQTLSRTSANADVNFVPHFERDKEPTIVRRTGRVIHGKKLGRQLGIPTANIILPNETELPFGVYAAVVEHQNRIWAAAASWGTRPHFGSGTPLLEVHLLDFRGNLYKHNLTVEFIGYLRPELAFASIERLMHQIRRDIADVRRLTGSRLHAVHK